MSSKIAAIGDIHGCLIELERLVERILIWIGDDDGTLILLGDMVDRGPDTNGVLQWIKDWSNPKIKLVVLKGNHEEMMIKSLIYEDRDHHRCWIDNGGMAAIISMGWDKAVEFARWLEEICVSEYRTPELYFVHAGINPDRPLDKQLDQDRLWIRNKFLSFERPFEDGVIVVHGHTALAEPEVKPNRINLDSGCCFGFCLSAAMFENGKLVEIISEPSTLPKKN